jgi:hypothetical protein
MFTTVQWRRWISKHHTRQAARLEAEGGNFTMILIFSLSGLALSLFAIGQGWVGDAEDPTSLFVLFQ